MHPAGSDVAPAYEYLDRAYQFDATSRLVRVRAL
jgi:hypothetical protein